MNILVQTQKLQQKMSCKYLCTTSVENEDQQEAQHIRGIAFVLSPFHGRTEIHLRCSPGRLLEFMAASYKATPAQEIGQRFCGWPSWRGLSSIRWG